MSARAISTERKAISRNLKALGLALVALLALSAVAASSASAAKLTLSKYPATLSGIQTGAANNFVLEGGRKGECEVVKYSGTYSKAEAEAGEANVTPLVENCTITIFGIPTTATRTLNGCTLKFTFSTFVSATEATSEKNLHIICPPGKKIETHVWETHEKHTKNETAFCTYTIGEQTVGGTVTYKMSGTETNPHTFLTVSGIELPLAVERTGGTLANCGKAAQTGSISFEAKFEAFDEASSMLEGTFEA